MLSEADGFVLNLIPMHVVWDWNGTLLDDLAVVIESVNAGVGPYVSAPITLEHYRNHYTRPVKQFYDAVLGRTLTEQEWIELDARFHRAYDERLHRAELARDAEVALASLATSDHSQSLLSMYPHDALIPIVEKHRIDHYFDQIDGLRGPAGDAKSSYLSAHLDEMEVLGESVLMVGDTPDDAVAAASVGATCVLVANGSHHRHALEATGAHVVDSIGAVLARLM